MALQRARAVMASLETRPSLRFLQQQHYLAAAKATLCGEYVIDNVNAAKAVLRGEGFFQPARMGWAVGVLQRSLGLISAEFFRTRISLEDLHMRLNWRSSDELKSATAAQAENPFIEYFREATLPRLRRVAPAILGLSVTHGAQVIPAFTLARLVREELPGWRIIMGGALIHHLQVAIARTRSLFEWVDAYVVGDGEEPLRAYAECCPDPAAVASVPNLIFRDPRSDTIVQTERQFVADLDRVPPPDFTDLSLALYLTPTPVLPLVPSRGCYWARCTFCSRKDVYRERSAERLVSDVRHLQRQHGAHHFFFAVDVISPRALVRYGLALDEAQVRVSWSTDLRAERSIDAGAVAAMAKGGCREVRIGMESGSRRVLRLIDKGIALDQLEALLVAFRQYGIGTRLSFFVGFPSETEAEASETVALVRRLWDHVDHLDFTYFALERGSELFKRPSAFGVTQVLEDRHLDLALLLRCEVAPGPSMLEVLDRFVRVKRELEGLPRGARATVFSKAHSLLLSSRPRREAEPLVTPTLVSGEPPEPILRAAADVAVVRLPFDLRELEAAVYRTDSKLNRLLLEEGRPLARIVAELDETEPPVAARTRHVVYQGGTNRITAVSREVAELLEECRRWTPSEAVARRFHDRFTSQQLTGAIAHLRRAGLLTTRAVETGRAP